MKTSESIKTLAPALLKAQKLIGKVEKNAKNPHFGNTYADLPAVIDAVKSILNEQGIIALQPVHEDSVETILIHAESGEWMSSQVAILLKDPNNPQAQGSAITYARRYGLQSMVLLPAEDDDGNAGAQASPRPYKPKEPANQTAIPDSRMSSPAQQKAIHTLATKAGWNDDDLEKTLKTHYGVDSTSKLTITQASETIQKLQDAKPIESDMPF